MAFNQFWNVLLMLSDVILSIRSFFTVNVMKVWVHRAHIRVSTLFHLHFSRTFPGLFKVKIKIFQDSILR